MHAALRSGKTPNAREVIRFYRQAKKQLPEGRPVRFVRGDAHLGTQALLEELAPAPYRHHTATRPQRTLLRVPALLVRHARRMILRLPALWTHRAAWQTIRLALST
ncbi:hypothetical protein [Limnochorda pilosa]|uniref:Uncharacterized protein n=1 Tax=Limnochorda pilosa TaxID=1555112 RepID=A0A0K2SHL1_LIMPI|nr:hypothetical protein [Limnochorda pilosa]BAS26314.1 hypothetical protein LIP_0457 [Limnochorda pilosa]